MKQSGDDKKSAPKSKDGGLIALEYVHDSPLYYRDLGAMEKGKQCKVSQSVADGLLASKRFKRVSASAGNNKEK